MATQYSPREITQAVREALDYQAAAQAGRNPNERRPLADVLAEQIPGELIPGLREMYLRSSWVCFISAAYK